MTKDEFIKDYCDNSHITEKQFRRYQVPLPCSCGEEGCKGWAAIRLDSYIIEDHLQFNSPPEIRRLFNASEDTIHS